MRSSLRGCALVAGALSLGCARLDPRAGEAIDLNSARKVADAVVDDLLAERHKELRQRMEDAFQNAVSEKDMPTALLQLYAYNGKPLEAEFKSDEVGQRAYQDGRRKPLRKFWYAVRTTKGEKGTFFLFVEVVPEHERLACAQFSIVSFASEPPPNLR